MEFRILGTLAVLEQAEPLDLGGAKQRALLALLLLNGNRPVSADRLVEALWGEEPPRTARKAVQVYVSQLRKALGGDRIRTEAAGYVLDVRDDEFDAGRFERLAATGRPREALALWRGPPLAEFAYQPFAEAEARRLEELRLACVEDRLDEDLAAGRHAQVVGELETLVAEQPLRERLRSQQMLALYRCGRQAEALEAYQDARRALVDALGIDPSPELQRLQRAILNHDDALAATPAPEPGPPERPSLPAAANRLIGRRVELRTLTDLLLGDARLVTVTGAGGSGKTRLALEVAAALGADFGQSVHFVQLAPLRQPELLAATILSALGVEESASRPAVESLKELLRLRAMLLVLDNFEQLLEGAPVLAELLAACPRLKLLVTSRASLHLSAEHEYPLEPLPLDHAVALFTERARAVRPDFTADERLTAAICGRLDCLPLALELAAARCRLLGAGELLARLERRLDLLTGGPRDLESRQQTLRSTIDWSYELLDAEEQRLLMRLAVFTGGCTLDAAEQVCSASLDRLESLVDKSLVRHRDAGGGGRFWLLETIREYALERLEADGDPREAHAGHTRYFLGLARELSAELEHGRRDALDALERELDNFRAALAWSERAEPAAALELTAALSGSWYARDQLVEGRRWLEAALTGDHSPSRELAVIAAELARLLFLLGELQAAAKPLARALELADALGLQDVLADATTTGGILAGSAGRHEEAAALLAQALAIAREHDLPRQLLRALVNQSHFDHSRDRLLESRPNDLEALELSRRLGNHAGELRCLANLLYSCVLLGEWDEAFVLAEELERTSLPGRAGDSLTGGLPWLRVQRGELAEARRALERYAHLAAADEGQERASYALAEAVVLRAEGRPREALAAAERAAAAGAAFGVLHPIAKLAFVEAVEAAFALDDLERAAALLAEWRALPPAERSPFAEAHHARFTARLAAARGDGPGVESTLATAVERFRALSMPFHCAVALLELGEWRAGRGLPGEAEPLLSEAGGIFGRLQAAPWLERAERALKPAAAGARAALVSSSRAAAAAPLRGAAPARRSRRPG